MVGDAYGALCHEFVTYCCALSYDHIGQLKCRQYFFRMLCIIKREFVVLLSVRCTCTCYCVCLETVHTDPSRSSKVIDFGTNQKHIWDYWSPEVTFRSNSTLCLRIIAL